MTVWFRPGDRETGFPIWFLGSVPEGAVKDNAERMTQFQGLVKDIAHDLAKSIDSAAEYTPTAGPDGKKLN